METVLNTGTELAVHNASMELPSNFLSHSSFTSSLPSWAMPSLFGDLIGGLLDGRGYEPFVDHVRNGVLDYTHTPPTATDPQGDKTHFTGEVPPIHVLKLRDRRIDVGGTGNVESVTSLEVISHSFSDPVRPDTDESELSIVLGIPFQSIAHTHGPALDATSALTQQSAVDERDRSRTSSTIIAPEEPQGMSYFRGGELGYKNFNPSKMLQSAFRDREKLKDRR